uniref:Three-finger toxin 2 n=1 Tax=Micrurus fulvius TaxID=8637 RepID=U3FVH6_MICFL
MKALLFALFLVAFLFMDPVKSMECYRCGVSGCHLKITCAADEKFCYKWYNKISSVRTYGCAETCTEENSWTAWVRCCTTNLCNT